jgi:hypothetical protein
VAARHDDEYVISNSVVDGGAETITSVPSLRRIYLELRHFRLTGPPPIQARYRNFKTQILFFDYRVSGRDRVDCGHLFTLILSLATAFAEFKRSNE